MIPYFLTQLTWEEMKEFENRLIKYNCKINSLHNVLKETSCHSCASIRVLVLLVQQNETGNSLTKEAQIILDTFYS